MIKFLLLILLPISAYAQFPFKSNTGFPCDEKHQIIADTAWTWSYPSSKTFGQIEVYKDTIRILTSSSASPESIHTLDTNGNYIRSLNTVDMNRGSVIRNQDDCIIYVGGQYQNGRIFQYNICTHTLLNASINYGGQIGFMEILSSGTSLLAHGYYSDTYDHSLYKVDTAFTSSSTWNSPYSTYTYGEIWMKDDDTIIISDRGGGFLYKLDTNLNLIDTANFGSTIYQYNDSIVQSTGKSTYLNFNTFERGKIANRTCKPFVIGYTHGCYDDNYIYSWNYSTGSGEVYVLDRYSHKFLFLIKVPGAPTTNYTRQVFVTDNAIYVLYYSQKLIKIWKNW